MTPRDLPPEPDPEEPRPDPTRRLGPTSPAALTVFAVVGLVCGWLLRPVGASWLGHAPVVTWAQPLVLVMAAAILGFTAWATGRAVHEHSLRLEPNRAVNRLVLGRACALVGALVAGGYLGYAVSWLGVETDLANQRLVRSLVAAAAGLAVSVTALLLERACRVPRDEDED